MVDSKKIPWQNLTVTAESGPRRLDAWLAKALTETSRRQITQMIARGDITVWGRSCTKGQVLKTGDVVEIWRAPVPNWWSPQQHAAVSLVVHRETADFLLVEKPSGTPSVPQSPDETGTLANALAALYPECAPVGRRPGDGGLLQRLDRETSGVVLVARSQPVHDYFSAEQRADRIEKSYLALVKRGAAPVPEEIDAALTSAGPGGRRMVVSKEGRPAKTALKVVAAQGTWCLVKARIHRGARHQIRAHLAGAGLPIAGDTLYGADPRPPGVDRLFLHAHRIAFTPPSGEERIAVTSPLPPELASVLGALYIEFDDV